METRPALRRPRLRTGPPPPLPRLVQGLDSEADSVTVADWLMRWRGWPHADERVLAWLQDCAPCMCDRHLRAYRRWIGR